MTIFLRICFLTSLALAACASPSGTRECVNGTFCPLGTECSGDGTTCVTAGRSRFIRKRCSSFRRCNPAGVM